ncbi:Protein of unknown function [Gryllus bimaculatus]|nr:Protein of unknown function [Gryllus bimaculatus]
MNKIEISSQSCFCLVTLEDITMSRCEPAWTSLRYQVSAAITCNTAQSNKIVRGSRMKVSISSLLLPIKVLFSQPLRSQTARLAS